MLPVMNRNWFPTVFDEFFDSSDWTPRFNATTPAVNVKENAKEYINRIEELTNTKIKFIGTGAGRDDIIVRDINE